MAVHTSKQDGSGAAASYQSTRVLSASYGLVVRILPKHQRRCSRSMEITIELVCFSCQ
jgi:hypothetical protein